MVGYNVQMAADAKHHLIVAHEVINKGHDRTQLAAMGKKALEATGQEEITALAGRSYMPSLIKINAYFDEALRIANA